MNELRMYVEHLFQGKVLTAENIELKEEIYGNLMARFEDLVAQGVSEEEALRRTKESFTSVDDVLADVESADEDAAGAEQAADGGEQEPAVVEPSAGVGAAAPCEGVAATTVMPAASGPTPPAGIGDGVSGENTAVSPSPAAKRKVWPWVVGGCVVAALAVAIGGALVGGFVADEVIDEDDHGAQVDVAPGDQSTAQGSPDKGQSGVSGGGVALDTEDAGVTFDGDKTVRLDGAVARGPLLSVVEASPADIKPFLDMAIKKEDASEVEALLAALPMGEYACDLDVTRGETVLSFAFRNVPESYEGDEVDMALAYDATALLCVFPEVNEFQITLAEADEPQDEEYYVFTREQAEKMYGVGLERTLINEAGWTQLRDDNLYRHDFAEVLVDEAERGWR